MSTKHRTLAHAVPTYVKIKLATPDEFDLLYSKSPRNTISCLYKEGDVWKKISLTPRQFLKQKQELYFAWFENEFERFHSDYELERVLSHQNNVIGTKKKIYFDRIESCGQDFTYERPYVHFIYQPVIKNREIELRKKFADTFEIQITVDELDNKLYKEVQELAVNKYRAKSEEIIEEIPIELWNAKLNFKNHIHLRFESHWHNHSRYKFNMTMIQENKLGMPPSYISDWYKKTKYVKVKNIEHADNILSEFNKYITKVLPKLRLP